MKNQLIRQAITDVRIILEENEESESNEPTNDNEFHVIQKCQSVANRLSLDIQNI